MSSDDEEILTFRTDKELKLKLQEWGLILPDGDAEFYRRFVDGLTSDVETVMLALGLGGLLLWVWSSTKLPTQEEVEEQARRWRETAREAGLKKRAEKIVRREIRRLAASFPVNGLMRYCICVWSQKSAEAGRPALGEFEKIYRDFELRKFKKEDRKSRRESIGSKKTRQKTIDGKIAAKLGVKDRTARRMKRDYKIGQ
jgi:hypothetical protein